MEISKLIYTDDRNVWRAWLEEHFKTETEVWLLYPMKGSGESCILYNDAVEEALCFGWIDSTIKHTDQMHRAQRFTPRSPQSPYSQPNIERLKWLDEQGMIHPEVRETLRDILETEFLFPEDIMDAIREDETVLKNYLAFSEPYKRIRIAYIDAARNRPAEFQKRLDNFIRKTRENKLIIGYGGIEKYYSRSMSGDNEKQGIPMKETANNSSRIEEIRRRGVLKVGTTGDYQPLSYLDPATGRYAGFDTELAEDLADDIGVGIEYVQTSWPALMDDVLAGKFDLAICGVTITSARKEKALMSDGYFVNGKTILCRTEDACKYTGLETINRPQVRVMVNAGGLNEQFARENLPDATLMIHDKNQEIPDMIACGKADIMITEIVEAGYYAGKDDRFAAPLIHKPFTHGQLGILMPKGSQDLLIYVNEFLRKEKESGRIDELAADYFFRYSE